ncbi:MAG: hypothetical protein U0326_37115 [Polyangiales bacterium]
MRTDRLAAVAALALALHAPASFAQDASTAPASGASVAVVTDAAAPRVMAAGPIDPNTPMPPGHPPIDSQGAGGGAGLHRSNLPESFATEAPELPSGVLVVRVVDGHGTPIPDATVRIGAMREGEAAGAQEVRTGPDGTARVERLDTDGVAYRLSTEHRGARFGAMPFQPSPGVGYQVQIVRHEVTNSPRAVLIWDARAEVRFKDDRAVVVVRVKLVNLTGMALGGAEAQPVAFVPPEGLRFTIPDGHTAFVTEPSMSDVRVTEEGNTVVVRGSIPPTSQEPVDVVFQYQMKLSGGDLDLNIGMPISVVAATVVAEAPPGLTLSVAGMPPAEQRTDEGDRFLITGVERRPDDPPITSLNLHLGGIPRAAGPARTAASIVAALLVLLTLGYALKQRSEARRRRSRAAVEAERDRVLDEMASLKRLRDEGEVGPVTFERRRRELALWLASLLKELDASTAKPA